VWLIASDPHTVRDLDDKWPDDLRKTEISRMGYDTQLVLGVAKARPIEQPEEPEETLTPEGE
jgi:hypothetical protein